MLYSLSLGDERLVLIHYINRIFCIAFRLWSLSSLYVYVSVLIQQAALFTHTFLLFTGIDVVRLSVHFSCAFRLSSSFSTYMTVCIQHCLVSLYYVVFSCIEVLLQLPPLSFYSFIPVFHTCLDIPLSTVFPHSPASLILVFPVFLSVHIGLLCQHVPPNIASRHRHRQTCLQWPPEPTHAHHTPFTRPSHPRAVPHTPASTERRRPVWREQDKLPYGFWAHVLAFPWGSASLLWVHTTPQRVVGLVSRDER